MELTQEERQKIYKPRLEFRRDLEASAAAASTARIPAGPRDGTGTVLTPVYSWLWTVFIVLGYALFIVPILIRHLIGNGSDYTLVSPAEARGKPECSWYSAMPR